MFKKLSRHFSAKSFQRGTISIKKMSKNHRKHLAVFAWGASMLCERELSDLRSQLLASPTRVNTTRVVPLLPFKFCASGMKFDGRQGAHWGGVQKLSFLSCSLFDDELSMIAVNKRSPVNLLMVEFVLAVSLTLSGSSCWHDSSSSLSEFGNPEQPSMINNDDGQWHRCKYF